MEINSGGLYNLSDDEVFSLYYSGSTDAEGEILQRYKNLVRIKARRYFLIGGDYDDIVQEGMIGLYKALRDYDANKHVAFAAFASLCVKRQIITAIKTASRNKHTPLNHYISLSAPMFDDERTLSDMLGEAYILDPEEAALINEEKEEVRIKISNLLSSFEKNVLELFLGGLSYCEISEKLAKDQKSIDNALQRIKKKLNTTGNA